MCWSNQVSVVRMIVLVAVCATRQVLAEVPVPVNEEDVLRMFTQRERERAERQWLRSLAPPPVAAPYDLRSLQQQLWYSQWRLGQQKGSLPQGQRPHCQPPDFLPPPPFRRCPNLPWR